MSKIYKISLTVIILFTIAVNGFTQNLVSNPSFEDYDTCPQYASMIHYASPWFAPTWGTPDYYNTCFDYGNPWGSNMGVPNNFIGEQFAKTGVGYSGLFLAYPWVDSPPWDWEYREYIEAELIAPLQTGIEYYVTFYLSLADSSNYFTNIVGIYFSNDSLKSDTSYRLHYLPQISNPITNYLNNKTGWMKFSGSFVASGGEKFITIGNFNDNSTTDTVYTSGGNLSSDYNNAYYYIDDICVSTDSLECNQSVEVGGSFLYNAHLVIYPNPANNYVTIDLINIKLSKNNAVKINNVQGQLIKQFSLITPTFSVEDLPNGIYFLELTDNEKRYQQKFIVNH